jgi:hypothetical protein
MHHGDYTTYTPSNALGTGTPAPNFWLHTTPDQGVSLQVALARGGTSRIPPTPYGALYAYGVGDDATNGLALPAVEGRQRSHYPG